MTFVVNHIKECFRAAYYEANGRQNVADRLRAQGKLRLMVMSDGEIKTLASLLANPHGLTAKQMEAEICGQIDEIKRTAGEWIQELYLDPADLLPRN